VKKTYVVEQL